MSEAARIYESIEQEARELSVIFDTMADGVFVIDNSHIILRWNKAMECLTLFEAEEAIGRRCNFLRRECVAGELPPQHALDCGLYTEGSVDNRETCILRKDGAEIPVIASARVLYGAQGESVGAVVTLKDISSIKHFEGEAARLHREIEDRVEFGSIVGKSHRMKEVFNLIEMAAASPVTVLIQGETGTGKELVAKAIHFHSNRHKGPLVTVNCSALTESLLESELFGHVRGAFTGAVSDHVGRFERANKGTIFLDEIGDIPPIVQVKLLRVLQEREFERVGDSATRKTDVRVITATNRDLRELVRQGIFRDDLYYRLKVFPLTLPPLRERKEDIEPLIRRFIALFNERTGKDIHGLSTDAMHIVMDYCWPGNVRELENAIEHAFVTCQSGMIDPFDLPIEIRRVELRRQICDTEPAPLASAPCAARPTSMRRTPIGREELMQALAESGWNKAEAARRLGVTRTSIWRRMKTFNVPLDGPN